MTTQESPNRDAEISFKDGRLAAAFVKHLKDGHPALSEKVSANTNIVLGDVILFDLTPGQVKQLLPLIDEHGGKSSAFFAAIEGNRQPLPDRRLPFQQAL